MLDDRKLYLAPFYPISLPLRLLRLRLAQAVSDRIPFIANLKPSGEFVMEDLQVGATLLAYLLMAPQAFWSLAPPVVIAHIKTSCTFCVSSRTHAHMLQHIGGTPAVLKYLLAKGKLHGGCMTVTGA